MATSWIEFIHEQREAADAAEVCEPADDLKHKKTRRGSRKDAKAVSASSSTSGVGQVIAAAMPSRTAVLVVVAVFATTILATSAILSLMSPSRQTTAAPVPAVSSAPEPVASSSVKPVDRCVDQPAASLKSPRGVVVAYQKAYFDANNEAVLKTLDPESYLAQVDWATVAAEMKGAEFCVKIVGVSDDGGVVDAATTVKQKSGDELVFLQKVHTKKIDGEYKITAIDDNKNAQENKDKTNDEGDGAS
ncbi:MAG: hypothetical protein D8B53_01470 [Corynebacterium sp.]|jgi:hypothetical protein|uniref:hypothetical protein n=1 Tax=Corynebacterium matruchotii TaxID=43768 RepID=UPI000F121FFC|nr:hypothetical protein [Corynebacterium matruchotii]RKW24784.1 MAG: hypothetical protein D8B53_01470 [Corynebacterium sp.]